MLCEYIDLHIPSPGICSIMEQLWISFGWVSQFYDTYQVRFSQSNLQKSLVLPQKKFLNFLHQARVSTFFLKNLTSSDNVNSRKFEYSQLSFLDYHKLGITLYY
jgi:hypothetical protein